MQGSNKQVLKDLTPQRAENVPDLTPPTHLHTPDVENVPDPCTPPTAITLHTYKKT